MLIDAQHLVGTVRITSYSMSGDTSDWANGPHAIGDVDGDGLADLFLGAYSRETGLFLFSKYGYRSFTGNTQVTPTITEEMTVDWVMAPGDVNGDGWADLVVGSERGAIRQQDYYPSFESGAAWVFLGGPDLNFTASGTAFEGGTAGFMIVGSEDGQALYGRAGEKAGDFNGDGIADIIVNNGRGNGIYNNTPGAGEFVLMLGRPGGPATVPIRTD